MSAASFDTLGTARDLGSADFPGCESFHLPASEIDRYEGRLEFWDGDTETAWKVCDPTSIYHEQPSRRLVRMAERVSGLRGSPIECFGSADLVRQGATGRKRWLMQADEVLYLHPDRSRLKGPAIDVDEDPLPDVVLEVDHTTDVRRRKLDIYKESGFPEVWVLVPWESSVRAPGLTIHVRREDGYREEEASRAFPGWKAEEIHSLCTDRDAIVGDGMASTGTDGSGDGRARGYEAGRRSAHAFHERKGAGADPHGARRRGALRKGHRSRLGLYARSDAPRRAPNRTAEGGGAGVHERIRLSAAHPRRGRMSAVTTSNQAAT